MTDVMWETIEVEFAEEKETKGTFKFAEVLEGQLSEPLIGTLYVRKSTLKQLGWEPGKNLSVTLGVV